MKITEYPYTVTLANDDVVLTDGPSGTRQLKGENLPFAVLGLTGATGHARIFRGKNLGSELTVGQKAAISSGTFSDLWLGDYWEIGGIKYRIADFDYFYNRGNPVFTEHHLVIVPDTGIGASAKMNNTSVTDGGYTGSLMYTANMASAKSTIETAFGYAIKEHKDYLINTVASGYPSAGAFVDSKIELMNEPMVWGCYMYTPANTGTTDVKRYTIANRQLALFRVAPEFILNGQTGYWLRDIASSTHFCRVDGYGGCTSTGAANDYPVRPYFLIG